MAKKPKTEQIAVEIQEIKTGEIKLNLLGTSPMIMNRFAQKAWQELLLPSVKKNRAGLEQTLKHDPLSEFRGAVYRTREDEVNARTAIHLPTGSVHGSIAAVAVDIPGTAKAKIERLVKVTSVQIDLYGIPQMFMAMVRNSDQNRTPDVRTRPIFPRWGVSIVLKYIRGMVSERTVLNLAGAAGLIIGIGDWRGQKGGPYGSYEIVGDGDVRWKNLLKTEGKEPQLAALEKPAFYDPNTEELFTWFVAEVKRREMDGQLGKSRDDDDELEMPDLPVILESTKDADRQGRYEGVEKKNGRRRNA